MENKRNKPPIGGSFFGVKPDNPTKELPADDEEILADTLTKTKRGWFFYNITSRTKATKGRARSF